MAADQIRRWPDRHTPHLLAAIHVERDQLAPRRLEHRQAFRPHQHVVARLDIGIVGARRIAFRQPRRIRPVADRHIKNVRRRIIGACIPVRAAAIARIDQRAALARADFADRRVHRTLVVLLHHLQRLGAQLRREVDQVVLVIAEPGKRRGLRRERLGGRQSFARNPWIAERGAPRSARSARRSAGRTRRPCSAWSAASRPCAVSRPW